MSAALFGITMTQMLGYVEEKAQAEHMDIQIIAYLDDAYVICKRNQATRVMKIMEDIYKIYDLNLNQAKSQWWTPHMISYNTDIGQIKTRRRSKYWDALSQATMGKTFYKWD